MSYRLYGRAGSGSMIVEAGFALAGVPVECVSVEWKNLGWDSGPLEHLNPLGQVPTVITPDGRVLTESAAILLHLAEQNPDAGLAPPIDHPDRVAFLRWLMFLISAVYPTFTYGDVPTRWVQDDEEAGAKLLRGTNAHRETLYRHLETIALNAIGLRVGGLPAVVRVQERKFPGA